MKSFIPKSLNILFFIGFALFAAVPHSFADSRCTSFFRNTLPDGWSRISVHQLFDEAFAHSLEGLEISIVEIDLREKSVTTYQGLVRQRPEIFNRNEILIPLWLSADNTTFTFEFNKAMMQGVYEIQSLRVRPVKHDSDMGTSGSPYATWVPITKGALANPPIWTQELEKAQLAGKKIAVQLNLNESARAALKLPQEEILVGTLLQIPSLSELLSDESHTVVIRNTQSKEIRIPMGFVRDIRVQP